MKLVKCDINEEKTSTSHTKKEPTYKRHQFSPTKYKSPDATAPFKICAFEARLELWRGTVSDVSRYTLCNESNLNVALPRGLIRDTQEIGYLNEQNYKFEICAFEAYGGILLATSAETYNSQSNVHGGRGYDDKGYACRWVIRTSRILPIRSPKRKRYAAERRHHLRRH